MNRDEILNQGRPSESNCFKRCRWRKIDKEELWYKIGLYDGASSNVWHSITDIPTIGKQCLVEYEADGKVRYRVDKRSEYEWIEACHYDTILRWLYIEDLV